MINDSTEDKAKESVYGGIRAAKLVDSRLGANPDMVPKCMDKDDSHSSDITWDQESRLTAWLFRS